MTRTPMMVLRCEVDVDGETVFAETRVSCRAWDGTDEAEREIYLNRAREALGRAIAHRCPPVTVTDPRAAAVSGPGSSR